MKTSRLEAFSDGIIAITITVLEIDLLQGTDFHATGSLLPLLLSYVVSFTCVGICWNNRHRAFQATERVNGKTHPLGQPASALPAVADYPGNALDKRAPCGGLLRFCIADGGDRLQSAGTVDRERPGIRLCTGPRGRREFKGWGSVAPYLAAIGLAFVRPGVSEALHALAALLRIVPDRRIERILTE